MPYVERKAGTVVGVYARPQPGYAEEELPDNHPHIAAFRARTQPSSKPSLEARVAAIEARLGIVP